MNILLFLDQAVGTKETPWYIALFIAIVVALGVGYKKYHQVKATPVPEDSSLMDMLIYTLGKDEAFLSVVLNGKFMENLKDLLVLDTNGELSFDQFVTAIKDYVAAQAYKQALKNPEVTNAVEYSKELLSYVTTITNNMIDSKYSTEDMLIKYHALMSILKNTEYDAEDADMKVVEEVDNTEVVEGTDSEVEAVEDDEKVEDTTEDNASEDFDVEETDQSEDSGSEDDAGVEEYTPHCEIDETEYGVEASTDEDETCEDAEEESTEETTESQSTISETPAEEVVEEQLTESCEKQSWNDAVDVDDRAESCEETTEEAADVESWNEGVDELAQRCATEETVEDTYEEAAESCEKTVEEAIAEVVEDSIKEEVVEK